MQKTSDIHVVETRALPSPATLLSELPKTEAQADFVTRARREIHRLIFTDDKRFLLIIGPCSIHDLDAGRDYARRLAALSREVSDRVMIVMRMDESKKIDVPGAPFEMPGLQIMAAVDDARARELHATADELGMSVLLEAHDEAEMVRALGLPSPLMGVNNRDLKRMVTDLGVTERLSDLMPPDRLLISESGVREAADIARLRKCGARGFLVGESLMRAGNPMESVRLLADVR